MSACQPQLLPCGWHRLCTLRPQGGKIRDCGLPLQELVAAKQPRLHRRLAQLGCDMTILATDWFLCLYATSLPCEARQPLTSALTMAGLKASLCLHCVCLCGVRRGPTLESLQCQPNRLFNRAHLPLALVCEPISSDSHVGIQPLSLCISQTALRVWDALLSEGGKVLYRVALALLRGAEPDLVAQDNAGDVLRVAKAAAAAAHDRDALMKVRLPGPAGAAARWGYMATGEAGHALHMHSAAHVIACARLLTRGRVLCDACEDWKGTAVGECVYCKDQKAAQF